MTETQLLKLKKEIDNSKEEVSQKKGQLTALLTQLKNDWGCDTVEKADKKLVSMKTEYQKMSDALEKGLEELEEKYEAL